MIIKKLFDNYKSDILYLTILLIVYIIAAIIMGPVFGDLYIDCGREVYIPELVLKGKLLYKEIFTLFPPFSYFFNALLYKIFGQSFKVLYFYSYINAWLVLAGTYLICRVFAKDFYAALFTLFVMFYSVFGNFFSMVSFIFPYAFAFPYAVAFFNFSLLSFLYFMKTDDNRLLYLSALLFGFANANKPEFVLCYIPVFAVLFFGKKKISAFLNFTLISLIPLTICLSVLFAKGLTFTDITEFLKFGYKFFHTPEQIIHNAQIITPAWNAQNLSTALRTFLIFIAYSFVNVSYLYLFTKNKYFKIFAACLFPVFIILNKSLFGYFILGEREFNIFCWQMQALFIVILLKAFTAHTLRDKMLFFVAVCAALSTCRVGFFILSKLQYGVFLILPLLSLYLYFIDLRPVIFAPATFEKLKKCLIISFATLSVFYVLNFETLAENSDIESYNSPKGSLKAEKRYADGFEQAVDWIYNNTKKTDTVLVLPEGVLLNHITERPSLTKFYQLPPNHISAMGEQNIVNELEKNKPDVIIINNLTQWVYGVDFMCDDFGFLICNFTYDNYSLEHQIDTFTFTQKIYKLKEQK